jgi:hypothetical protein
MTETHDPWARVIPLRPNPYSHQNYYVEEEVNAARAAVERQHAAALATLRAQLETLTGIVRDTLWMAGRYADRRMSYAVGLYNDARVKAEAMGCADGATIAIDGMDPELPTWAERITDLRASIASVEGERDRLKASPCVDGSPHYCPNCDRTGYYVVSPSSAPAAQTPETTTDTVKPEVPNLMAALKKSLEQLTPTGEKDPR